MTEQKKCPDCGKELDGQLCIAGGVHDSPAKLEEVVSELYDKNPYRYRHIGNRDDDGLENVRIALISYARYVMEQSVPEESNGYEESGSNNSDLIWYDKGVNHCRTQTLERAEKLLTEEEKK